MPTTTRPSYAPTAAPIGGVDSTTGGDGDGGGNKDIDAEKLGLMIGLAVCVICTCVLAGIMVYLLSHSEEDEFITSYRNDVLLSDLATPPPPAINIAFSNSSTKGAWQDDAPDMGSHFFPGDFESYLRDSPGSGRLITT